MRATGRRLRARWVQVLAVGAAGLVGVTTGLVGLSAPLGGSASGAAVTAHATIGAGGPTVSADPTTGLGPDQWSYVSLSDFPVDDTVTVSYCSDAAGTDLGAEPCDLSSTSTVVILADGTAATSLAVSEVDPSGAAIPGDNGTPFYCTNDSPCSIDVTDRFLNGDATKSADNTAVIPISFATGAAPCPAATTVSTASEYGLIQQLLSQSAAAACSASAPATAFNTELDAVPTAQSLASGSDQIAFVDNPDDPAVQTALGGPSAQVAYIPVALTANVLGFKATESFNSNGNVSTFPDNSFALTPTMVAGFLANVSSYQQQAQPPPDPVPCTSGRAGSICSLINELNPAQPGFGRASAYGAFVRAGSSGSTYSLEQWLCSVTTDVPVSLPGGTSVTESETPDQTLTDGFGASATACPGTDQVPALSTSGGNWFSEVSPAQQANKLEQGVAGQTTPSAFFAPMVWSEALYNGLNVAALQNGAGAMTTPAATSIDAALSEATTESNGTLAPAGDPTGAAYPMPDVVYAVVSTTGVPSATAAAERTIVSSLLDTSSPTATSALPGGFVPLTSALYAEGESALAKALPTTSAPGPATTPGTTPSKLTTFATGAALALLDAPGGLPGGLGIQGSLLALSGLTSTSGNGGAGSGSGAHPLVVPTPLPMKLLSHDTAWLVPWFLGLLVAAAVLGPLLLSGWQVARRRVGSAAAGDEGGEGDGSGDGDGASEEHASSPSPELVEA
jgi:hypothetical protein